MLYEALDDLAEEEAATARWEKASGEDDLYAIRNQRARDGQPDAARPAGHNRDLALQ